MKKLTSLSALILIALATSALAQFTTSDYPMVPYEAKRGVMAPNGLTGPMVPSGSSGGGPPVSCSTGAIDLSTGCVQPMLGVL